MRSGNGIEQERHALDDKFDYSIHVAPEETDYRNATDGVQLTYKGFLRQMHARFARASRWSSWKMAHKCENEGQLTSRADIERVFEPLQLPGWGASRPSGVEAS